MKLPNYFTIDRIALTAIAALVLFLFFAKMLGVSEFSAKDAAKMQDEILQLVKDQEAKYRLQLQEMAAESKKKEEQYKAQLDSVKLQEAQIKAQIQRQSVQLKSIQDAINKNSTNYSDSTIQSIINAISPNKR